MSKETKSTITYVLDTSVLLFDHTSIYKFKEHDVSIPIPVLAELDKFKVGNDTLNFEARSAIRLLDKLFSTKSDTTPTSLGEGLGNISIDTLKPATQTLASTIFGDSNTDNQILDIAVSLNIGMVKSILVSKDINLRLKAKSVGISSENFLSDDLRIKDEAEEITTESSIQTIIVDNLEAFTKIYANKLGSCEELLVLDKSESDVVLIDNGYYILSDGGNKTALTKYNSLEEMFIRIEKTSVFGIKPKNVEQSFAIDALLDDNIKCVAIEGLPGSGKTLLSLAAGLEMKGNYDQILMSRPIIPLSNQDIGFLPGDPKDKIAPYMQPLFDNLKFIKAQSSKDSSKVAKLKAMQEDESLEITALAFIRGRSINSTYFIIDEAQNLTPHEIKTIVTRAGNGTKVVFTGDPKQIDTPYLDERSNGLSYLIGKLKGEKLFSHIKLKRGERSALANLANDLL